VREDGGVIQGHISHCCNGCAELYQARCQCNDKVRNAMPTGIVWAVIVAAGSAAVQVAHWGLQLA